jgi:hypothetical protein
LPRTFASGPRTFANQALFEQLKNLYSNNIRSDLFETETIMPNPDLSEQQTSIIHAVAATFQPTLRQQSLASIQDNLEGRGAHVGDAAATRPISWKLDCSKYQAIPFYSDGKLGATINLRPLFAQYNDEVTR